MPLPWRSSKITCGLIIGNNVVKNGITVFFCPKVLKNLPISLLMKRCGSIYRFAVIVCNKVGIKIINVLSPLGGKPNLMANR